MTKAEYDAWQLELAQAYAEDQVSAGRWRVEGSVQRALEENARALPHGAETERMIVRQGVLEDGTSIGRVWACLDHPRGAKDTAYLYDIEVDSAHRGHGYGRGLLTAIEDAVREAGATRLELNVFGGNAAAIGLYESNGYTVNTQQMIKEL